MIEQSPLTMTERVRTEQIKVLYDNLPLTVVSTASVSVVLAWLLSQNTALLPLLIWLAANALLWVVRIRHYWIFKRIKLLANKRSALARETFLYSLAYGIVWSWIPIYYIVPDNLFVLSNVGLFVVGMIAGALVSQAVFLPSLYAFLLPIAIGTVIGLLLNGGDYAYLSILCAAYMAIAVVFAHRINLMMVALITTRFENETLIEALREQKIAAEQANLAKSKFLVAASHDMRQPLHALSLYVGLLKDEEPEIKQRMGETLAVLSDLYDRVLEVSQLDAGVVTAQLTNVDVSAIAESAFHRVATLALEQNITMVNEIQPQRWVVSDSSLLARVIDNLLSNALRYTPQGGSITMQVAQEYGHVTLKVIDTGIGIAPDQLQNVFLEFTQLNNPERDRRKGMGLGLAIVKRLCDLLHHQIKLESELNCGTTFSMEMRIGDPQIQVVEVATEVNVEEVNVLLIEDDETVRTAMLMQFDEWGCFTEYCTHAEQLDQVLQRPDIVVADYRLPGQATGMDAVNKLRHRFGVNLPAIVITGDTGTEVLSELERENMLVLHKPVEGERLKQAMARAIGEGSSVLVTS